MEHSLGLVAGAPTVGLDEASGLNFVGDEAMQGLGGEIFDGCEADAPERGLVSGRDDLDSAGD